MENLKKQHDVNIIEDDEDVEEIKDFFLIESRLNPIFTFENFVEEDCNESAILMGRWCVKPHHQSGGVIDKCYFYGNTGTGKTHLVNAIGNAIKQEYPEKNVLYVDAYTFEHQYYCATFDNEREAFLRFYKSADVLIVDDIQLFANKEVTQHAFLQIFNHLEQNGKQILLTTDCPRYDLFKHFNKRLFSRISGMIAEPLRTPNCQMMRDILCKKYPEIKDEIVVDYIAKKIPSDVRALDGVAKTIIAYLTKNPKLDYERVKSIVSLWTEKQLEL